MVFAKILLYRYFQESSIRELCEASESDLSKYVKTPVNFKLATQL